MKPRNYVRPRILVGVLGTHTEVGKTHVAAQWLMESRLRGLRVSARKPVQSFALHDATNDAVTLGAATGEAPSQVCAPHREYPLAVAPPMAAELLRKPRIVLDELIDEISWDENIDFGLVETVGGPRSPLCHDADSLEFLRRVQPDRIVLVADAALGAINAVRLSLECIGDDPVTVFLNRYDATNETHRLNRSWLFQRCGVSAVCDIEALMQTIQ